MKRPLRRHRMPPSRKRLKRRLVLVSMLVCSGVFGVLYVINGAQHGGRRGTGGVEWDHGGGTELVTRLVGSSGAAQPGGIGEGGAGDGEAVYQTTDRILASAYCDGGVDNGGIAVLYITGVVYCFLGLAIVCDEFFQTSLEKISDVLGLTPDVAGATFLAAGSSAPELFTSLADAFGNANSTGTGTIVGSAMFNILVIVALSAAVAGSGGRSIHIDWRPVCRDIIFYTFSIAVLGLVFIDSEVMWWEGLIMFLSYIVYIIFMKYNSRILAHCQPPRIGITDEQQVSGADVAAAVEAVTGTKRPSLVGASGGGEDTAKVAPLPQDNAATAEGAPGVGAQGAEAEAAAGAANATPKSLTLGIRNRVEKRLSGSGMATGSDENKPLVLGDQNQVTADEENGGAEGKASAAGAAVEGSSVGAAAGEEGKKMGDEEEPEESRFAWPESRVDQASLHVLFVLGLPMLMALSVTIPDCGKPRWEQWYVVSFLMSLAWIGVLTHYMVVWVNALGCFFEVSPIFMGLVVLAIGTSVPDAMGSMIAARSGEANMAIANAVGSNVFDVLIGLGFPWFLRGIIKSEPMPVDRDGIALNVIILFCTAVLFVSVLAANDWSMNTKMGIFLFCLYVAYVIFVVIRELVL
ncbi:unnamed protein product [Ectocarpus fasciculatus]